MRTIFSSDEVAALKRNPCVFSCTERSINYTYEFKKRALELYAEGVGAKEIWRRAGFDVTRWKKHYFRLTIRDWRRVVARNGLEGLTRLGGIQFDRGPRIDARDTLGRLEMQVRYLKAENDFLAKLRAKRAESNSGPARNTCSSES